jgi:hypothetical protein
MFWTMPATPLATPTAIGLRAGPPNVMAGPLLSF